MPFPSAFSRSLAILAAGLGLAVMLGPQTAAAQASGAGVQVPDTADAVVRVHGMACSACAQRMKRALEDVEGVERATVLLEKQDVVLTLAETKVPSETTLREAVTTAGYTFESVVFAEEQKTNGADGSVLSDR